MRPKVGDLRFVLFSRPLHPELFDVIEERHICRDDYQAIIRITEACHWVTWRYGDLFLTEVLTPANHPLPRKRKLLMCRMGRERTEKIECWDGVVYYASFMTEQVHPSVYVRLQEEMVSGISEHGGLMHRFRGGQRIGPAPLSFIRFEARRNGLLVHAFHSFPDEFAFVKSQSLFEFPLERRNM
jgi:hypothetical protein